MSLSFDRGGVLFVLWFFQVKTIAIAFVVNSSAEKHQSASFCTLPFISLSIFISTFIIKEKNSYSKPLDNADLGTKYSYAFWKLYTY